MGLIDMQAAPFPPVQESKLYSGASWEAVSSQAMMAICSLHPDFLSPLSALGEDNIRLTVNTPRSNVTDLVEERWRIRRKEMEGARRLLYRRKNKIFI